MKVARSRYSSNVSEKLPKKLKEVKKTQIVFLPAITFVEFQRKSVDKFLGTEISCPAFSQPDDPSSRIKRVKTGLSVSAILMYVEHMGIAQSCAVQEEKEQR